MIPTKKCSTCEQIKSIDEFHSNKSHKDGYAYICKTCRKVYSKKYGNSQKGKLVVRKGILKFNYGLTLEEYDMMFDKQNGVCAICSGINISGRRLAVDHNHKTGKIRGLLCHSCNMKLAAIENIEFFKRAKEYLIRGDKGD